MHKTLRLISEQGDARARIDTLMAQDQTIRRLLRSIDRYRSGLEHYADRDHWMRNPLWSGSLVPCDVYCGSECGNGWEVADEALAEEEAQDG